MASKNLITQSIGRVVPVVEAYRVVNGNNREVLMRISYSEEMAKKAVKHTVRKQLENTADSLHLKLDKILKF